jgi:hypothetical protein
MKDLWEESFGKIFIDASHMKKLLLILFISFALIGSVKSKPNVPLPSEEDVFEYIYHSIFSNSGPTPYGNVQLRPRDYGLFKNHLIFQAIVYYFENQKSDESLEWSILPTSATSGLFYSDGISINYLYGRDRKSNLKHLLKKENLQFKTTDPSALANFVSEILFTSNNSGAYVVDDIRDIFRHSHIVRNENPSQINHNPYANDIAELEAKIEEKLEANMDNPALSTYSYSEFELDQQALKSFKKLAKKWPSSMYGGFTPKEMENLSHDELVKIAKERGHKSLSGIIKPRLTKLDKNWILEFTTLSGWMHDKNKLVLNRVSFSPKYEISSSARTLNNNVYSQIPPVNY